MNTTIITIVILEIFILGLILHCLLKIDSAVNRFNQKVKLQNQKLKSTLSTLKSIFSLSHEYLEMWKVEVVEKIQASINLIGELVVYYLMHKIFKKHYENFEMGFNFTKFFWS